MRVHVDNLATVCSERDLTMQHCQTQADLPCDLPCAASRRDLPPARPRA